MPFFAKADMDNVCYIDVDDADTEVTVKTIHEAINEQNCKRNNVLYFYGYNPLYNPTIYQKLVASYCRYDRNVVETAKGFTCVLYAPYPRAITN